MKTYFLLSFLVLFSACATSSDFDVLRRDINGLQKDSLETKKEIDSLREKTAGTVKEDSFSAVRENQADINTRLSAVSSGLQELRGRFEEHKFYLERTMKDWGGEKDLTRTQINAIENQLKTLKDKLTALEESAKSLDASRKPSDGAAAAETPAAISGREKNGQGIQENGKHEPAEEKKESPDDRTKTYESAYQAFKDKRYKEARGKFEAFIRDYPKNELSDNAQFWIAETYFAERDFEGAILAYETVLKQYPESEKTSGALLKQGFAFIEIGDSKTGRAILGKLVEKFPDSKDAAVAKKKLADAEKKPGRKK